MPDLTASPDRTSQVLLGAYALGTHADASWDAGLTDLDLDGFEHPLPPVDGPPVDAVALIRHLPATGS